MGILDYFTGGESEEDRIAREHEEKVAVGRLMEMGYDQVPDLQVLQKKIMVTPLAPDTDTGREQCDAVTFLSKERVWASVDAYARSVWRADPPEVQQELLEKIPHTGHGTRDSRHDLRLHVPAIVRADALQVPVDGPGFTSRRSRG
ncbi:MAG: hypothetical protein A2542_00010 [Parcubacteria group bacterium RIFOXYD2_FULL_52_8]|nr:MAG: hypothetical protein A2542_00010 [Parcubacteria group bacterium RIFOXYD2_FULL_52_8]